MQLRRTGPLLVSLLLGTGAPALAQASGGGAGNIPFERYRLDNGLEVILSPDRSAPVVSVNVWYHVGSGSERPGRTGFAHLFEHMMFQGSQNVGKGEHMQLVERAGGTMNGTTNEDRTNYFESLPANRLNLGLWLEADRMRSLAVTQENLDNQREVVKEERRLRIDNAPYGAAFLASMFEIPYSESCPAYGHSVIGSMEDLDAARLEDVREFFATYYAPGNATLTVTGDFDPTEARRLIQEYFGSIPRATTEAPRPVCEQPFAGLPVDTVMTDPNANLPALLLSYGLPDITSPDLPALRLLASILADGESSRLHRRLVREEKAALQMFSFPQFRRGPGILLVGGIVNQGVEAERIRALVDDELRRIHRDGVTAAELAKAKNQFRAQTVRGLQTALGRAEALQRANLFFGDPAAVQAELTRTQAVTLEDVKRVASQYLTPRNRAKVIAQPAAASGKE